MYAVGVRRDTPSGLGATDVERAYNLPWSSQGSGQTIAAVDAFDAPNAAGDLATYNATYGLPAPNFAKYNQFGEQKNYPRPDPGRWTVEESLDIEMLSAGCPLCTIILVEANSAKWADIQTAVDEAVKLGATVVSNSYSGRHGDPSHYDRKGVTFLASAGDAGYGIKDPADFPSVVSVGGTDLTPCRNKRGWCESTWSGTGSGCSAFGKPRWQTDTGCPNRTDNDVAAVATDVAVLDSYDGGWFTVAGTSISSPLVGSIFGLAGNSTKQNGGRTFWMHKHHRYLYDITSGSNGSCTPAYLCTARIGYDGPTGWGTPNGTGAF
jgi:subtilase family serine protease